MDHLVHVEPNEIVFNFELGQKSKTVLHIRSLMHTMPVAFKLQTTSPEKFCVRPPSGYLHPLSDLSIEIILKPQRQLPPAYPLSREKFVLKTALAHALTDKFTLPERVPNEWFSSPQTRVFIDAKLKVVYVGTSLLWHCVAREDEHSVKEMLARHSGNDIADKDGRTALHIAASIANIKMVNTLLEHGADINAMDMSGRTPLWEAVHSGNVDIVRELLRGGALTEITESLKRSSMVPIHIAATLKSTEILQHLIESGAKLEIKDPEGRTAVHVAVESEKLETLKVLLQAGADKNAPRADGKPPLLIAAENGFLEGVNLLLEGGTSPCFESKKGYPASAMASERGYVAITEALQTGEDLLRAARQGNMEAVAALLQHSAGKKAWVKDSAGWTPLHVAAFKGHVEIMRRLLLEEGGRTALQMGDVEGHTPLHCAAEGGSAKATEFLLSMGADPCAVNNRGATPVDLANALGFIEIAKLIHHHAPRSPESSTSRLSRKLYPLHRRSTSPGPNLTSATCDANRNDVPSVSTLRFSTPTKLHQNKRQQHNLSSPLDQNSRRLGNVKAYSIRNTPSLASLHPPIAMTSERMEMEQTPESPSFSDAKNEAEPTTSSVATSIPEPARLSTGNTASLACLRLLADGHIHPHNQSQQAVQSTNPNVQQSKGRQLRQEKEKGRHDGNDTSMLQHFVQIGRSKLQSSQKESLRPTLASLLDMATDSKMEFSSSCSSSEIPMQDNTMLKVAGQSSPDNGMDSYSLADGDLDYEVSPLFEKDNTAQNAVTVLTLDMLPKCKPAMRDHLVKTEHEPSLVAPAVQITKLHKPSTTSREHPKQSSSISATTKPLHPGLSKNGEKAHNKFPDPLQQPPSAEESTPHTDSIAVGNSVSSLKLQQRLQVSKKLSFDTLKEDEAQQQLVYENKKGLGVCNQTSTPSTATAQENMASNNGGQITTKSLHRQTVNFSPLETSASTINEGLNKPSPLDADTIACLDSMTTDKLPQKISPSFEGIKRDMRRQQIPYISPSSMAINVTNSEGRFVTAFEGQGNLPQKSLTKETSVSDVNSSGLKNQEENQIRKASAPDDTASMRQKMKRSDGACALSTYQTKTSEIETDKVPQVEESNPIASASLKDENKPSYTPPLTIKQMRKPVSIPPPKTSDSPQQKKMETTSEAMPADAKFKRHTKSRSLVFSEIFGQSAF